MFHEEVCIHFTLYINKYIIVLFSGDAESRGKHGDPEANADCMKTRERKKRGEEKEGQREGSAFRKQGGGSDARLVVGIYCGRRKEKWEGRQKKPRE